MAFRITESRLRQIIREEIEPAPPRSPLDKFAFAEQRPSEFDDPEINNDRENALLQTVIEHFMGGPNKLTEADCKLIQGFLKKGIYSDIFTEPVVPTVYRGMNVDENFLKKLGVLASFQALAPGRMGKLTKQPRTIDPLPGAFATSWSTAELGTANDSESVVWNFATGNTAEGRRGNVGIVLCADVSANPGKFFDAQPLYSLEGMPGVEDEMEAVGMGSIVCRSIILMKLS